MFPPFPSVTRFLQISTGGFYSGLNAENLRDDFKSSDNIVTFDKFSLVGSSTLIYGAWTADSGDITLPNSRKEPRVFCTKGKMQTTVSGTAVYVRLQLNSGWGTASVYIDGVKPSTISGIVTALDTLNCNSDTYTGVIGTQYMDILVADGIPDGNHLVEIYANNSSDKAFFVTSGVKGRGYRQFSKTFNAWRTAPSTKTNYNTITLSNQGAEDIVNTTLTIPSKIVKQDGTSYGGSINIGKIAAGTNYTLPYTIDGTSEPSSEVITLGLSASYADPTGSTSISGDVSYGVSNVALTYTGSWNKDNSTPTGVLRAFNSAVGNSVSFATDQTSFTITVQREYGWGSANVTVAGTTYATVTSNDPVGGQFLKVLTVTGLPAGMKTVKLVTTTSGSKPFVFTNITVTAVKKFSVVSENIALNYNFSDVPAFPPTGVNITNGVIGYTAPTNTQIDYSIPRTNEGLVGERIYTRFPTFAVYYSTGQADILSEYDILIIEPSAVTKKQVLAWQAKGIKVIGYISFGEEDGTRGTPFDLGDSSVVPFKDDGGGPGGYASYYNKGGNFFGETSECQNDRQKLENVKACAVSNPKYLTGAGRCSPCCSWDYRDGYATQSIGGACGKGYTIANNWQRDAMKACVNKTCPQYLPLNQKCTQYQQSDGSYGQDYSLLTTDFPDQNGIWGSTFINPLAPRWEQKILTEYLPSVFGSPVPYTETLTLASFTASSGATFVCRVTNYPFDDGEPFVVTSADGTYTWTANLDFSYDAKTGVISFNPQTPPLDTGVPTLANGTTVKVVYSRMGLGCDGMFMDTVDTVDVYPSPAFQKGMSDMINRLKSHYPNKAFTSNRGFTVLDDMIQSCDYVMFESFLSDYNFDTNVYSLVTDQDSINYNLGIKDQLFRLRKTHKFDVFGLNYCSNGSDGDAIRQKVMEQCYEDGFMSWTSTIDLNQPIPIKPGIVNLQGALRTNAWEIQKSRGNV